MPSEAFCFEGAEGKLTIRLWSNASVEAVEYEHDYWHDVVPISAPNRYDVMACMDHECAAMQLLGECEYPNDEKVDRLSSVRCRIDLSALIKCRWYFYRTTARSTRVSTSFGC